MKSIKLGKSQVLTIQSLESLGLNFFSSSGTERLKRERGRGREREDGGERLRVVKL